MAALRVHISRIGTSSTRIVSVGSNSASMDEDGVFDNTWHHPKSISAACLQHTRVTTTGLGSRQSSLLTLTLTLTRTRTRYTLDSLFWGPNLRTIAPFHTEILNTFSKNPKPLHSICRLASYKH